MGISIKGTRKTMNVAAECAACEQVQVDRVEQLGMSVLFNLHLPFSLTLPQKTGQDKLVICHVWWLKFIRQSSLVFPECFCLFAFETGSYQVAHACLKLEILLPYTHEYRKLWQGTVPGFILPVDFQSTSFELSNLDKQSEGTEKCLGISFDQRNAWPTVIYQPGKMIWPFPLKKSQLYIVTCYDSLQPSVQK